MLYYGVIIVYSSGCEIKRRIPASDAALKADFLPHGTDDGVRIDLTRGRGDEPAFPVRPPATVTQNMRIPGKASAHSWRCPASSYQ